MTHTACVRNIENLGFVQQSLGTPAIFSWMMNYAMSGVPVHDYIQCLDGVSFWISATKAWNIRRRDRTVLRGLFWHVCDYCYCRGPYVWSKMSVSRYWQYTRVSILYRPELTILFRKVKNFDPVASLLTKAHWATYVADDIGKRGSADMDSSYRTTVLLW